MRLALKGRENRLLYILLRVQARLPFYGQTPYRSGLDGTVHSAALTGLSWAMFSWPFGPAPFIADCGAANRQPQPLRLTANYLLLPFHCPCGQPGNNMLLRRQVECNCWYHGQGNECQNASPIRTILTLELHNS